MTAQTSDSPPAPAPHEPRLPHPSHLSRLPAGLAPADLFRVQQAAYQLPQVVTPLDYPQEHGPSSEKRMESLGLILLQKGAGHSRPSRWIAPDRIAAALRHLDALGAGGKLRALMIARTAELESIDVTRHEGGYERLLQQALPLTETDATIRVAYRAPVPLEPVWDFYRTGDLRAFKLALGTVPPHPDAEALRRHLDQLVLRSETGHPEQMASLVPKLQADCARPQPFDALCAALSRTQDRWERQAAEQETIAGLNDELAFQGYPDTFALARSMQRTITLFVGPPNSGKTHAAFERLATANSGCYLAPLRLLALEGRDRLVARGVPTSLLTGEENDPADNARVVSSTIEMVGTSQPVDVAVIDEAQMLFDASRGWAWTQAIVAVPANEVLIICSSYAVPAIENLLHLCGESCTVRRFERKQHVQLLPGPVPIAGLKRGDAVVAFSRRDVLMMRDQIAANGHAVSVIYGALPPEVRRNEAERFAQGHSDILVATDAIGMGLNLPIRRVLFSTMEKFDGVGDRELDESEVHQIAGRAGRYGLHEEGFAGVLREAEPTAARVLKERLQKQPRAPRDFKAAVAPNWWHVETIASRLYLTRLRAVLDVFVDQLRLDNAHFAVAQLDQMLDLAAALDHDAAKLTLKQRFLYAQAPVDTRTEAQVQAFLDWAHRHSEEGKAGSPWFLDEVDEHSRLDTMENALRACTLWLWLDLRLPGVFGHVDEVVDLRARLNAGIERHLKGKKPLWMRTRRH